MPKDNLTPMARSLLKAGLPGKEPEAAHIDREPVPVVNKELPLAWDLPAEGVVTTSKRVAKDLVRVCACCGEEFKVIRQGDSLPTVCSSCSTDEGNGHA
jgi:hypothetical protein